MFTFKDDTECEDFIKLLQLDAPMFSEVRSTFRDPFKYRSIRAQYLGMIQKDSTHFETMKSKRPRIHMQPAGVALNALPLQVAIIHVLEVPMVDLPLYINSRFRMARETAKWRLRRCPV